MWVHIIQWIILHDYRFLETQVYNTEVFQLCFIRFCGLLTK